MQSNNDLTSQLQAKRQEIQQQIDTLIDEIKSIENQEREIANTLFQEAQEKVRAAHQKFSQELDEVKANISKKLESQSAQQNQEHIDSVREQLDQVS